MCCCRSYGIAETRARSFILKFMKGAAIGPVAEAINELDRRKDDVVEALSWIEAYVRNNYPT